MLNKQSLIIPLTMGLLGSLIGLVGALYIRPVNGNANEYPTALTIRGDQGQELTLAFDEDGLPYISARGEHQSLILKMDPDGSTMSLFNSSDTHQASNGSEILLSTNHGTAQCELNSSGHGKVILNATAPLGSLKLQSEHSATNISAGEVSSGIAMNSNSLNYVLSMSDENILESMTGNNSALRQGVRGQGAFSELSYGTSATSSDLYLYVDSNVAHLLCKSASGIFDSRKP